jgi:hypothetical protein
MISVEVPPEYRDVGFSGDFWLDVDTDTPLLWRRMVPCPLGNSGWMALRVNDDNTVTVVRKDAAAIIEAVTGRPLGLPVLTAPLGPEDWVSTPSRESLWLHHQNWRVVAHQLHPHADLRANLTRCGRTLRGRLIRAHHDMPRCQTCLQRKGSTP